MSNLRKLKRAQNRPSLINSQNHLTAILEKYVQNALSGKQQIEKIGNFVLFSSDGDAWLLHSKEGMALNLASNYEKQPYVIQETSQKLLIGWDYSFKFDQCFITTKINQRDKVSMYPSYPTEILLKYCSK